MIRKQLELVVPQWKLNPKNFGPNIKSIQFLGSGVKTRLVRFPEKPFLGLRLRVAVAGCLGMCYSIAVHIQLQPSQQH